MWLERTREAQAVAYISQQSAKMIDEQLMRQAVKDLINSEQIILRPATWGFVA